MRGVESSGYSGWREEQGCWSKRDSSDDVSARFDGSCGGAEQQFVSLDTAQADSRRKLSGSGFITQRRAACVRDLGGRRVQGHIRSRLH